MEEQQIIDHIGTKKIRHRKKQLYNSIRTQMEFYFSDSNLSKDRFIAQLIRDDPFINLSVFLKFNKVRNLTTKIEDICKALRKSEILELSEDNLKVRRKTAVNIKENEDECTIYVERLPVDAEHEWLKNIFSKFGTVDYVSIPKYKHNKMIKGFAFVEFNSADSVKKVLDYFESIGCKLPTTMLPNDLASIATFEKEVAHNNRNKSETTNKETDTSNCDEICENQTEKEKPSKKRKATDDENSDTKKKKIENEETKEENDDSKSEVTTENKKNKNKAHKNSLDLQQIGLQVLSKKEWKQLRNKYLNLQKQKMKNLKDQFHRNRFSNNIYNAECHVDKTIDDNKKVESAPRFKFTSGTIVSFQLPDMCLDVKKFKSEMRAQTGMEYIDIQPGDQCGYFRFTDNENAKKFCESIFNGTKEILEGDAEKDYWDKIMEYRENKFKKEGKKQRGRDKLLRKAEKELGKHIKFDD